jgi:hypothetical protein
VQLATDLARASEQPDPGVLATLAAAYAETGNYSLAIQMVQQAILMSPATAGRYQLQLNEYEAGRAYRRSR